MAKRSTIEPQTTVQHLPGDVIETSTDTGIYLHKTQRRTRRATSGEITKAVRDFANEHNAQLRQSATESIAEWARSVLRQHGARLQSGDDPTVSRRIGGAVAGEVWSMPADCDPMAEDAADILKHLFAISLHSEVNDAAFREAVFIGMALERLQVRPFEIHVRRGRKLLDSAHDGHESIHGTTEEKQRRWTEYQQAVDGIRKRNPFITYTGACRQAAGPFGVSQKTITRHTNK